MASRSRKAGLAVLLLLAAMGNASADWRQQASDNDIARLAQLDLARARGLQAARAGGGRGDASAIAAALSPQGHAIAESALPGAWRCRQIKLGGMTSYLVYGWFDCRIRRVGGGLFFEKRSGGQRTNGFLKPDHGSFVYLGASNVEGEPAHRYSGRAASLGPEGTPDDQIGLLSGIGNNHLRLELPAPEQQSDFDVIELRR